jgi:hypothetical protein
MSFLEKQGGQRTNLGQGCENVRPSLPSFAANDVLCERMLTRMSCFPFWTVQHETGHALGLSHEQSRSDRDQFHTINWKYIKKSDISESKIQKSHRIGSSMSTSLRCNIQVGLLISKPTEKITMATKNPLHQYLWDAETDKESFFQHQGF